MLLYNYTTLDNEQQQVQIELLDNKFVNEWRQYLTRTAARLPSILWNFTSHGMSKQYQADPLPHLNQLHHSFVFLQQHLGLDFDKEIADLLLLLNDPYKLTQVQLNRWHRHFTTVATEYYSGKMAMPTGVSVDQLFHSIHAINQSVHDLEFVTYPTLGRRAALANRLQYSAFCADARALEGSNALWVSGHAESITDSFDPATEEYHYDVWINEDIQGKDHMKAWLDEDDLLETDVWGNSFMTPNVMFDPHMIYASIIDNPAFMADYQASAKKLNRWPLGKIVNTVDWPKLTKSRISSIVLDNITLWKVQ